MIREYIDLGWDPYFINFMFNHIPGDRQAKMDVMIQEVTRVHHIFTRHIVRRPEATAWRHLRPMFMGCHDLPVWKHAKEIGRGSVVNDGLHYNAIAFNFRGRPWRICQSGCGICCGEAIAPDGAA